MGRGNVCVHGKYETLYYVDYEYFPKDEMGDMDEYDYMEKVREITYRIRKRFPSLTKCNHWVGRDARAILENDLFHVAVQDNEWSLAVMLLQKDDVNEGLQRKHFTSYDKGIKETLFKMFPKLGVYGGPWVHGVIEREDI